MAQENNDDPFQPIAFGDFGTYIKNKRAKLQLQFDETAALAEPDTPQIFAGLVIYVNGYTYPPIQVSKSSITHVIASNLTQAKMKEFRTLQIPASTRPLGFTGNKGPSLSQSTPQRQSVSKPTYAITKPSTTRDPMQSQALFIHTADTTDTASGPPVSAGTAVVDEEPGDVEWFEFGHGDSVELTKGVEQNSNIPLEVEGPQEERALTDEAEDDELFQDLDLQDFQEDFSEEGALDLQIKTPQVVTHKELHEQNQPSTTLSATNPWILPRPIPFKDNIRVSPIGIVPAEEATQSHIPEDIVIPVAAENDPRHPTLIELSVPWNRLNSSVQPGFVEKFYQSSRLHYLSTWKAKLRDLTAEIQKNHAPIAQKAKNRVIMTEIFTSVARCRHVDFDCFFASVAIRGKPELADKPIGVAHGSGGSTSNSEIASCNYLARDFGVKNGMHLQRARSLCPNLVVVPYEFQQYEDISIEFYRILLMHVDELQAVSVDEALVDVTSKCRSIWEGRENTVRSLYSSSSSSSENTQYFMDPGEFAQHIRDEIFEVTGCHASVGIGPNVLLAKLSTKRAKPHGQYIWPSAPGSEQTLKELQGDQGFSSEQQPLPLEGDHESRISLNAGRAESESPRKHPKFPKELSVKDLPGVGYKTTTELEERFSVTSLYQLQQIPKESLQNVCGMKTGTMLWKACRGIDDTILASDRDKLRQSVSAEISWGVRFENQHQLELFVHDLATEVSKRLKEIDRMAKSVVVKIMKRNPHVKGRWKHLGHGPCDQFARTGQLPRYTDDPELIAQLAMNLINYFRFDVLDLRGIGIQMMKLNNETINFMDKSSNTSMDTKNQTTLSSMFQPRLSSTGISTGIATRSSTSAPATLHPQQQLIPAPAPEQRELPSMEIDKLTFKELPIDIQDELKMHHTLVFIDNEVADAQKPASGRQAEEAEIAFQHPGDDPNILVRCDVMAPPQLPLRSKANSIQDIPATAPIPTLPPWSQLDPAELATLSTPAIRHTLHEYAGRKEEAAPRIAKRALSDYQVEGAMDVLPSQSQIDMSVLDALPKDIREEIEREYSNIKENSRLIQQIAQGDANPSTRPAHDELPLQADREAVEQALSRTGGNRGRRGGTRSRPRGRPRSLGKGVGATGDRDVTRTRNRPRNESHAHEALDGIVPEADAAARIEDKHVNPTVPDIPGLPHLDPEFLAALPDDIRAEIENERKVAVLKHRQKMQQERGGSDRHRNQKKGQSLLRHGVGQDHDSNESSGDGANRRAVAIERPTLMGLREVGPLRKMLSEWVQSTLVPASSRQGRSIDESNSSGPSRQEEDILIDEGPNPEDVQSFSDFVVRVIYMERDLERVRVLLAWLERKVKENQKKTDHGMMMITPSQAAGKTALSWPQALERILAVVNRLVGEVYGGVFSLK
ncbi:deoxycytidyl transferase [Podila humilis]|nr:deoxycytidyl transferase [Podila humilis]